MASAAASADLFVRPSWTQARMKPTTPRGNPTTLNQSGKDHCAQIAPSIARKGYGDGRSDETEELDRGGPMLGALDGHEQRDDAVVVLIRALVDAHAAPGVAEQGPFDMCV